MRNRVVPRALAAVLAVSAFAFACSRPGPAPPPPQPSAVPARAADLRPVGRFRGVLPCADCEGVRTDLLLAGNWEGVQRYHLSETWVGVPPRPDHTAEREGTWVTLRGVPGNAAAKVYQLDPDLPGRHRHFLVVDDRSLRLLDDALDPVGAPLVRVDGR